MSGNPVMIHGVSALDRLVARIEIESRDLIGAGRQSSRALIDREILGGYADHNEIDNEDRIGAHGVSFTEINELAQSEPEILEPECKCVDGRQCQICCTQRDLMTLMEIPAIARGKNVEIVPIRGSHNEVWLIIPLGLAHLLHFM